MNPTHPPSLLPAALPPAPAGGGGERGDDDGLGRDLSVAPGPGSERDTLLVSPLETDAPGQKSAGRLSGSTTSWSSEADVEQPPQLPHQARHRDFSRVNDSLPSAHWDPLSDQRWNGAQEPLSGADWSREIVLELRRVAYIMDSMLKLLTIGPMMVLLFGGLYYIVPFVISAEERKRYFPGADETISIVGATVSLLGALYFFLMLGIPKTRGAAARGMAWRRPDMDTRWDVPGARPVWKPAAQYAQVDMMVGAM